MLYSALNGHGAVFFENVGASGFDGCLEAWVACRAVYEALVNPFMQFLCADSNVALAA